MNEKAHLLNRTDLSNFIVHLTRDTKETNKTAKANLIEILNSMKIEARNYHCLFNKLLDKENEEIKKKFYVCCFTETPINKLKDFLNIANRKKDFKPYGIIFFKDTENFAQLGGYNTHLKEHPNPVLYVTNLNKTLINMLTNQYNDWLEKYKNSKIDSKFYLLGSIINYVGEKHDFSWEREWRVVGNYEFIPPDIVTIIAPEEEHEDIRDKMLHFSNYLTLIDLNWSFEKILVKSCSFGWNNRYKYEQVLEELNEVKNKNDDNNI